MEPQNRSPQAGPPGDARNPHPYESLTPDRILAAVEAVLGPCTGRMLALNSYENRVYQVELENGDYCIAKFYRPGRWSDAAIAEEHAFALELAAHELPVVAPLADDRGRTLHHREGFRLGLFPRVGGRWPGLDTDEDLRQLGRALGRIHRVAAAGHFHHRPVLEPGWMGRESIGFLLTRGFIPADIEAAWRSVAEALVELIEARFCASAYRPRRLLGDCHRGNILWQEGPRFVDLDDALSGPPVQDLWMLLDGEREVMARQLHLLLEGYTAFHEFDPAQLGLIEALRGLRLIHYSAWLARRWEDPAFPRAFPWFNTQRYWEEQVLALREQTAAMAEPPLPAF